MIFLLMLKLDNYTLKIWKKFKKNFMLLEMLKMVKIFLDKIKLSYMKRYKTKIKNKFKKILLFLKGMHLLKAKEKYTKKNILINLINIAKDGIFFELKLSR